MKTSLAITILTVFLLCVNLVNNNTNNQSSPKAGIDRLSLPALERLQERFAPEWHKQLNRINPDHFYTFVLTGRKEVAFIEVFDTVPCMVEGAFSISDNSNDKIFFYVKLEEQNIVYHKTAHQNVFKFNVNLKGRYYIVFENKYSDREYTVSFSMGTSQNQHVSGNQLEETHQKIKRLEGHIKNVYVEEEFLRNKFLDRIKGNFFVLFFNLFKN